MKARLDRPTAASANSGVPAGLRPSDLQARLDRFGELSSLGLRAEWTRLFRAPPPARLSRDVIILAIGWKVQIEAHGGIPSSLSRRLSELARTLESNGDLTATRAVALRPGAKLVRAWGGRTHEVLVTENGFVWNGRDWRSLSAIAREITGARWSGPRFFGLKEARNGAGANPPAANLGDAHNA